MDYSDGNVEFWQVIGLYIDLYPVPRPRLFRSRLDPLVVYDDIEFRVRYRLTKDCFLDLLNTIHDQLLPTSDRLGTLPPVIQLLIAVRFFSSGSFQISVGDHAGVSQPTVCRVVRKVAHVLAKLASGSVTFPATHEQRAETVHGFYKIASFPGVLGAIDCTHVAVQSPGGATAEVFRNRKGFFSLNVQGVVNSELLFTNIVARWPGSCHDANIWAQSRLCARFESHEISNGYLLGDAGYPCKPYLLTPLTSPASEAERRYNYAQTRTRNPVERAFGVLKRRFPCLRMCLRVKVKTACSIVTACVVLHNACIRSGDHQPPPEDLTLLAAFRVYGEVPQARCLAQRVAGTASRTALIRNHFTR